MDDNNDLIKEINDLNETAVRLFETYDDRFKELEVEAIGIVSRLTDITDKNIDLINKAKEGMIEELQGITDDIINARDAAVNDIINLRNTSEASITKLRDESIAEINAKTDSILEKIADAEKYISDLIANAKTDIDKKVSDAKNDIDVLTEAFRTLGENITAEFIDLKDSAIQSLEVKRLQSIDDLNAEYIKDRDLLNDLTNTSKDAISKATTDGVNELKSVGTEYLDDLDKKVNDGNTELTGTKNDGKDEIVVAKDLAIEEINAIERGNANGGTWLGTGYGLKHMLGSQRTLAPLLSFRPTFAGNITTGAVSETGHIISYDENSDTLAYIPNSKGVMVVTKASFGNGMVDSNHYHWIASTDFVKLNNVYVVDNGKKVVLGGTLYFPDEPTVERPGVIVYDIENLEVPDLTPYPMDLYNNRLVLFLTPFSTGTPDWLSSLNSSGLGYVTVMTPNTLTRTHLGSGDEIQFQQPDTNALHYKDQTIMSIKEDTITAKRNSYNFTIEGEWDYRFTITLNLTEFKEWMDSQPDPINHPTCDVGTFMVENANGDAMCLWLQMRKGKLYYYGTILSTVNGVRSYFYSRLYQDLDGFTISDVTYKDRGGDLELNCVIDNKCLCLKSRGITMPTESFPADAPLGNMAGGSCKFTFGKEFDTYNYTGDNVTSYGTREPTETKTIINVKSVLLANTDLTTSLKMVSSDMWLNNFNATGIVKKGSRAVYDDGKGSDSYGLTEKVCESFNDNEFIILTGESDGTWIVSGVDATTLKNNYSFTVDLGVGTKISSGYAFYKIESLERSFNKNKYIVTLTGYNSSKDRAIIAGFDTEKRTSRVFFNDTLGGWSNHLKNFISDGGVIRGNLLSSGFIKKWESLKDGFGSHYSDIYPEVTGVSDYNKNPSKEYYGGFCYVVPYRFLFMVDRYSRLLFIRVVDVC